MTSPLADGSPVAPIPARVWAPWHAAGRDQGGGYAREQRSNPQRAGRAVRLLSSRFAAYTRPPAVCVLTTRVLLICSITDAETNLGESEVREALLAKANFFVKIGDKVRPRPRVQLLV